MLERSELTSSDETLLLVGGTASIRGEGTVGTGSLGRQTLVTLQNLALVVKTAFLGNESKDLSVNGDLRRWLACFRHIRVYYARRQDQPALSRLIGSRMGQVEPIEWTHAPLCRPELLVEIEGVALLERR